ncbi:hypothetical protein ABZP36_007487 [Zizania latifolia]
MRLQQALSPFVLSVFLAASASSALVLENGCQLLAANHAGIDYSYCVRFFQADKGSATADMRGLAAIAVSNIRETAANNTKRIAALRSSARMDDEKLQECLGICSGLYEYVVGFLNEDARGVGLGEAESSTPRPPALPDVAR